MRFLLPTKYLAEEEIWLNNFGFGLAKGFDFEPFLENDFLLGGMHRVQSEDKKKAMFAICNHQN